MSCDVRISVVTVVKNGVSHLEETINSVIEIKAAAELDYIVIDGGSTDGTTEIINKYADQISYWVSEADNGIYDAMNKGWAAAADNSFVLFIGSGDKIISLPDDLTCFSQNDVVYGSVRMGENIIFKPRVGFHLRLYNSLHHQALLVNKSLHPTPPFNINYLVYGDFDFNQRLKKRGVNFIYSPYLIGYAYPGGVSDRQDIAESLRIILANYGLLWAGLALSGYYAMKVFPFLKRFRPLVKYK